MNQDEKKKSLTDFSNWGLAKKCGEKKAICHQQGSDQKIHHQHSHMHP